MSEIDFIFHENEEKVIMRYAERMSICGVCAVSRNLWPKLAYCCVDLESYYNFQPIIGIWLRFDEQEKSENQVTLSRFIFCWINDSSDWEWCNRWRWITTKDIIVHHFWEFFSSNPHPRVTLTTTACDDDHFYLSFRFQFRFCNVLQNEVTQSIFYLRFSEMVFSNIYFRFNGRTS